MSSSSRLVLPVALGLSLVTVTAFVVYYVFKKDEDEIETGSKTIKTSRMNIIEIKVSKSIVPALIGRGGSNIKEIEKKSGALINFKKLTDTDYDVCMIRGRSQATQLAEMLVHDFLKQQPLLCDDSFTVPNWAVGRIIGTAGTNVADICHRSGARVKVEGQMTDKTSERTINIRGTKEQIYVAKQLIENYVSQEKCRREVEQAKNPRHVVRSSSHSPSPSRSVTGAGGVREPEETGERPHAKYKRPGPEELQQEDVFSVNGNSNGRLTNGDVESTTPSIEVYVSAVSSPSRFWVQFVGPQVAQLDELVTHMTEYYGNKENRAAHALNHVSVGQVVAAVFRHDGKWYRARVHDIRPNEFDATQEVADVFFLDYGDSEYVATHELCELRADLLRLRFQAMECFLAGVRPADSPEGEKDKWSAPAIERFEELAQVARWKPLVSRTCTYKKTPSAEGDKEKEIPGIKLYDVSDEGEMDVGAVLIEEGFAVEGAHTEHTHPSGSGTPFGDLGNSRVLGMLMGGGARSSSLPKDHKDDQSAQALKKNDEFTKETEVVAASQSLASGLEKPDKMTISNLDLDTKPHINGSTDFLDTERLNLNSQNASSETLTPKSEALTKIQREECKANMNRIDSHHSNLEALGRTHELQ